MIRLGILGSRRGRYLQDISSAIDNGQLNAEISLVISDNKEAGILSIANTCQIPSLFIDARGLARKEYDNRLSAALQAQQVDMVLLIGFMRILSPAFVHDWAGRILNVHPSLLPAHAGLMDLKVHESVLRAGDTITGCTVHEVTTDVDAGPVVLQKVCPVYPEDTPEILKQRVQVLESLALIEALKQKGNEASNILKAI